jgi:hypothetical protein
MPVAMPQIARASMNKTKNTPAALLNWGVAPLEAISARPSAMKAQETKVTPQPTRTITAEIVTPTERFINYLAQLSRKYTAVRERTRRTRLARCVPNAGHSGRYHGFASEDCDGLNQYA